MARPFCQTRIGGGGAIYFDSPALLHIVRIDFMDGFCKFAAGILCAFFLALCLWLSWDVLTAPSNASDSGIAMLCDYARPGDVPELERLCSRIGSPWWAEY